MLEQGPGRTCDPVEREAHAGGGLLVGPVTPWGTHIGAGCAWRTGPTLGQFMRDCSPWEALMLKNLVENCLQGVGETPCWRREQCEAKGAAVMCNYCNTHSPFRSKFGARKKGWMGESCFKI